MIDSPLVEERIQGLIGIECDSCLGSGFVQTWREDLQSWSMILEEDPVKDGDGKVVRRMKVCYHGKAGTDF